MSRFRSWTLKADFNLFEMARIVTSLTHHSRVLQLLLALRSVFSPSWAEKGSDVDSCSSSSSFNENGTQEVDKQNIVQVKVKLERTSAASSISRTCDSVSTCRLGRSIDSGDESLWTSTFVSSASSVDFLSDGWNEKNRRWVCAERICQLWKTDRTLQAQVTIYESLHLICCKIFLHKFTYSIFSMSNCLYTFWNMNSYNLPITMNS